MEDPDLKESSNNASIEEELYDNIVWTHKIHEKQADIYSTNGKRLQIVSIACIAITAVLAGVGIGVQCVWLNIAATVFDHVPNVGVRTVSIET